MTRIFGSLANDGAGHIGAAPVDHGLASTLGNLAYAVIRPLRYRMLYYRILGDLTRLDDDVLRDIGLARRDIGTYARSRAQLRWPARHSLWAVLGGVAATVWRALRRGKERRMTIRDLMMLDDRTLKDIGLSRSQIPWIANDLLRRSSEVGVVMTARSTAHEMARVDDRTHPGKRPSQGLIPSDANAPRRIAAPANDGRMLRAS